MSSQQSLNAGAFISKSWHPDPASTREDIWFDDINKYLYLDFRKSCATSIRIATWKSGLAVQRWNTAYETWQSEEWDPGIPLPLPKAKVIFPLDEFYSEFPADVLSAVAPFKWRQFVLLRMIRHCPETMELLQSNPVLTWFCADATAKNEAPVIKVHEIIMAKRRDICAFVGLPATDSMVRILGKMRADKYTQDLFNNLQKLFKDKEKSSQIRFFKKIPMNEIGNLWPRFDYLAWALSTSDKNGVTVWETMGDDAGINGYRTWADTIALGRDLGVPNTLKRLASCKSFAEFLHIHNSWGQMLSSEHALIRVEKFFQDHGTYSFPSPPLPGDADIVPITTIKELLEEGSDMHNCVASYAERVMSGECSIYRVLRPQRATLEVSDTGDTYHIRQLKLARNEEPSTNTWAKVRFWFVHSAEGQNNGGG